MVYFAEGDGSYNYLYDMIVNILQLKHWSMIKGLLFIPEL